VIPQPADLVGSAAEGDLTIGQAPLDIDHQGRHLPHLLGEFRSFPHRCSPSRVGPPTDSVAVVGDLPGAATRPRALDMLPSNLLLTPPAGRSDSAHGALTGS